jgi:hypothetical protein
MSLSEPFKDTASVLQTVSSILVVYVVVFQALKQNLKVTHASREKMKNQHLHAMLPQTT